ncbi:MAG: HPF/RaiA family ribosome-associated protein [Planctomycetota bacterium]|nr:HPF/RaiA family ribosome-associated protein [Planctomycetota bacterium]
MRVLLRSPHVTLEQDLRDSINADLRAALAHVEDRVVSAQVKLDDVNGPKGGLDKNCEVIVNCGHLGILRVEAKGKDLKRVVASALTKLRRAVEHAVDHKRGAARAKAPHRRA